MSNHAAHHWCRRLFVTIIVALVLVIASVVTPIRQFQANAAFGEGGSVDSQGNPSGDSSKYLGMIDWVDWSKGATPADLGILEKTEGRLIESKKTYGEVNWDREDAGTIRQSKLGAKGSYDVQSETILGDKKIATSCSLSNLMEDAHGKAAPKGSWLNIHIPGQYTTASGGGDGWDNVYQRFDKASQTGLPVGIGRAGGGRIRFDVKCHAEVINKDGSRTPIPINGLVFSDGEAMTKGEAAYIVPSKIDSEKPVNWRVLEYSHTPGDPTYTELRLGPQRSHDRVSGAANPQGHQNLWQYSSLASSLVPEQALEMTVPHGVSSAAFQPFATMYASNADGAYIDLWGGFGNYITIGIVIGADVSDGPASYGQAAAISQPDISDTESILTQRQVRADQQTLAKVQQGAAPFLGKNGPDLDTQFLNKSSWTTLRNDDLTNSTSLNAYNDEDAFDAPLLVTAQPGKFTQTVACQPAPGSRPTNVSAWLDWNSDGRFSESERANAVCEATSKSARLQWEVTERMLPPAGTSISPSLIRLIATLQSSDPSSADYFGPTGLVSSGEVEDHAVTLVRPTLSVHKRIVGSDGQDAPNAANDGFTFTATALGTFFQKLPLAASPAGAEVKLVDVPATQTTSKGKTATTEAGSVLWPLAFNDLPTELTTQTHQQSTRVAVKEEKITSGFQFWPGSAVCKTPTASKAPWTHTIPIGDPKNGRTIEQPGTYAWPTPSSTAVTHTDQGFTVAMSPTSVLDCSVSNQPFGQISIKPTVTFDPSLSSVPTLDDTLKFSGEFVCTPPATTVAGRAEVTGTWGPVAKDEVWISNPGKDLIPAGSNCKVTQTMIGSPAQQKTKDAAPSIHGAYSWKSVRYTASNQITAGAVLAGETLPQVTVENIVDEPKSTTLSWTKVDETGRPLGGAKFRVWTSGRVATEEDIVREEIADCVADEPRGCAGMTDTDPREGYFTIPDAFMGDYLIEETQAPAGYVKTDDKLSGKIVRSDLSVGKNAGKLTNVRVTSAALPSLPMSGGLSTIVFAIVGTLALAIAAIAGIGSLRRRQGGATQ